MTVFKHGRTFRTDFWWPKHPFKGNTHQLRVEDAKDVQRQTRRLGPPQGQAAWQRQHEVPQ